jgi:hypothetical protein
MDSPTSGPADWRSRYGFDQGPSQASQDYWRLNGEQGNLGAQGVNAMPFVLNPAAFARTAQGAGSLYGLDGQQNKGMLYGGSTGTAGGDPMQQILGLVKSNPSILPLLLQQLQGQGQGGDAPPSGPIPGTTGIPLTGAGG